MGSESVRSVSSIRIDTFDNKPKTKESGLIALIREIVSRIFDRKTPQESVDLGLSDTDIVYMDLEETMNGFDEEIYKMNQDHFMKSLYQIWNEVVLGKLQERNNDELEFLLTDIRIFEQYGYSNMEDFTKALREGLIALDDTITIDEQIKKMQAQKKADREIAWQNEKVVKSNKEHNNGQIKQITDENGILNDQAPSLLFRAYRQDQRKGKAWAGLSDSENFVSFKSKLDEGLIRLPDDVKEKAKLRKDLEKSQALENKGLINRVKEEYAEIDDWIIEEILVAIFFDISDETSLSKELVERLFPQIEHGEVAAYFDESQLLGYVKETAESRRLSLNPGGW